MLISLEYKRISADGCTGKITRNADQLFLFDCLTFDQMMRALAQMVQGDTAAHVVVQRTDRHGISPYALGPATTRLLAEDPEAAIASMRYPESPSVQVQRVQRGAPVATTTLRAGYDVLADSFGEDVYCRVRNWSVECPGCGFWNTAHSSGCRKGSCGFHDKSAHMVVHGHWAATPVSGLLGSTCPRFFLPRAWNSYKPWVSREDLQTLFYEFCKQKEQVK